MGARIPPEGGQMPQGPQGQGGGGAAELVANVAQGLEAIAQMVGSQFGPDAGQAIAGLQQQFQQIMSQVGQQGQQAAPGDQAGVAEATPAGSPAMRQ